MKNSKIFYLVIVGLIVAVGYMIFYTQQKKKEEYQKNVDHFNSNREQIVSSIEQLINSEKFQDALDAIDAYSDKYASDDIFVQLQKKIETKKEKRNQEERTNKILSILTKEKPTLQGWCFGNSLERYSYDENKDFFDQYQWVSYYKDLYAELVKLNPDNEKFIQMELEFYQKQISHSIKRESESQVAQKKRKELIGKFGNPPDISIWGVHGDEGPVMEYLKQRAHNPPSVSIIGCSKPGYTSDGWILFCEYRGQNAFGAMIHTTKAFTIVHGKVTKMEEPIIYGQ